MPACGCGCTQQHMHIHEKRALRASEKVFSSSSSRKGRLSEKQQASYKERGGSRATGLLDQMSRLSFMRRSVQSREKYIFYFRDICRLMSRGGKKKDGPQLVYKDQKTKEGEGWRVGGSAGGRDKTHFYQVKKTHNQPSDCFSDPASPCYAKRTSPLFVLFLCSFSVLCGPAPSHAFTAVENKTFV